jgi:hypothetical protein
VRYFAIALAASLAAYTGLAMAHAPTFAATALGSVGFVAIYPFDIVLGLALLVLVAADAFFFEPDPISDNRLFLWLCLGYLGYQLFVVLPAAVLLHDMGPIDGIRALEVRLSLILVLAVYAVVLRYCRPRLVVTFMDIAAVALALWTLYLYLRGGQEQGSLVDGRYSVRVIWGGASLLFGWLFFTSVFYWPIRWWRLVLAVLAVGGIVLANHRSGFVALLAALVVQLAALGRVTRRVVVTAVVVAIVAGGVYYMAPSVRSSAAYSLRTMFSAQSDANAQDRVVRTRLGFDYFMSHPLGDYIWSQRYYLVNVNYDFAPHNFVVQMLDIQGIIASLLYFAVLAMALFIAGKNRRDSTSAVMLAYLAFYLVFCLFNTNIDQYENQALLAVTLGLILHQNRVISGRREAAQAVTREADDACDSAQVTAVR